VYFSSGGCLIYSISLIADDCELHASM
jgi:hypothetical protein